MPKVLVILICVCCISLVARAQDPLDHDELIDTTGKRDLCGLIHSLFGIKTHDQSANYHSIYFSAFPSTEITGSGRALITSTSAAFYLGNRASTYISDVSFAPTFSFDGHLGIPLHSNLWLKDNSWYIPGDTRFLIYPQYTWGIGGSQASSDKMLLNYRYLRIYQSALKRITPYFFAGLGYNLDDHMDMQTGSPLNRFAHYSYGTVKGSISSGASINLLYDTRNNALNPMPGCYANVIYRVNTTAMGSNNNWQSLYIDLRKYVSLTKTNQTNMLAFWSCYWTTTSGQAPYLDLPSIGWDAYERTGRGLPQNRYRGNGLLYFETEYRRDITKDGLLGFVVFSNITSVTQPNSGRYAYWHPAGGTGLRVKLNRNSNTNIALDYALSRDYSMFNVSLGEAF